MKTTKPTQVLTPYLIGLSAALIHAEALVEPGGGTFTIHGFTEATLRETRVRVRCALQQVGVDLGNLAVTVALSPHEPARSGGSYDLALAVAVLAALGRIPAAALDGIAFIGELSLTGAVRPVRGVLPALRSAVGRGVGHAVIGADNAREAASVPGIKVGVARHLADVIAHFAGTPLPGVGPASELPSTGAGPVDFSEVRGQASGRRGMEIAAAGGHDVLLCGPVGAGKTMLARRLSTILPLMGMDEALEATSIHSVAGLLSPDRGIITARPFRAPHHTVSTAGLVGGGDGGRAPT